MSRRKKKAEFEVFSLAFLDCICCGFGAMILVFVLTVSKVDRRDAASRVRLQGELDQALAALAALIEKKSKLGGDAEAMGLAVADLKKEMGDLDRELAVLTAQLQNEDGGAKALLTDIDDMKKQVAAMQRKVPDVPQLNATSPIGIPVESNHVAFVIDTSGSMRDPNTEMLLGYVTRKFEEVLEAYPQVKGVQFLDADGRFILGRSDGWIPDSPDTRREVIAAVRRYGIASNSNPVPGIVRAIRSLYDENNKEMKMGIYIFGDEFTETSEVVLERIDRINPPGTDGKRPVTINAIGFPNLLRAGFSLGQSGVKFANLMRELTTIHGGAFLVVTGDPD